MTGIDMIHGVESRSTWEDDPTLTIPVTSGVGRGPTSVAAFDAALRAAGVANFNLIRLSSVIPTGAAVQIAVDPEPTPPAGGWGDRLYVVYADARATEPGQVAAACVGWVQNPDDGSGLFVEVEGHDEAVVRQEVTDSLHAMTVARDLAAGPPVLLSRSVRCEGEPVCALVIAPFTSEAWR